MVANEFTKFLLVNKWSKFLNKLDLTEIKNKIINKKADLLELKQRIETFKIKLKRI